MRKEILRIEVLLLEFGKLLESATGADDPIKSLVAALDTSDHLVAAVTRLREEIMEEFHERWHERQRQLRDYKKR